jgi:hypothetical protein
MLEDLGNGHAMFDPTVEGADGLSEDIIYTYGVNGVVIHPFTISKKLCRFDKEMAKTV